MSDKKELHYTLSLNEKQAQMLSGILDMASRIGIGQFEIIEEWARMGSLKNSEGEDVENLEAVRNLMDNLKQHFGHPSNGSSAIVSKKVPETFRASYEIKKALDREMAMNNDPNPKMKTVNYDGLSFRLTKLPKPRVYSNGEGENSDLHNFIGHEVIKLRQFDDHWRKQSRENPEEFPQSAGGYAEWCEQFELFKELE